MNGNFNQPKNELLHTPALKLENSSQRATKAKSKTKSLKQITERSLRQSKSGGGRGVESGQMPPTSPNKKFPYL
jgi:hypothetical protein